MAATNTNLDKFMAILNRTGFDPTDLLQNSFDFSNAHPVTAAFMMAAAEQVEDAARKLGVHAEQLRGSEPRALRPTIWDRKMQPEREAEEEGRPTHGNS